MRRSNGVCGRLGDALNRLGARSPPQDLLLCVLVQCPWLPMRSCTIRPLLGVHYGLRLDVSLSSIAARLGGVKIHFPRAIGDLMSASWVRRPRQHHCYDYQGVDVEIIKAVMFEADLLGSGDTIIESRIGDCSREYSRIEKR